jgi:hypothetical protein
MAHVSVLPFHISSTPMGYRQFPETSSRTIDADLLFFPDVDDTSVIDDYCYYVVIFLLGFRRCRK